MLYAGACFTSNTAMNNIIDDKNNNGNNGDNKSKKTQHPTIFGNFMKYF